MRASRVALLPTEAAAVGLGGLLMLAEGAEEGRLALLLLMLFIPTGRSSNVEATMWPVSPCSDMLRALRRWRMPDWSRNGGGGKFSLDHHLLLWMLYILWRLWIDLMNKRDCGEEGACESFCVVLLP